MKLKFLGTKGEIEEESKEHSKYSGLLVESKGQKILLDCGEIEYLEEKPETIILTHAHPDHSRGLAIGTDIPVIMTKVTRDLLKQYALKKKVIIKEKTKFKLGNFIIETAPVLHSIKAPTIGIKVKAEEQTFVYAPDFIYCKDEDFLRNAPLLVADGSSYERDLIRKKNKEIFGHASVKTIVGLAERFIIPRIIFTHFGKWAIPLENTQLKEKLSALSETVKIRKAVDGMEIELGEEELIKDFKTYDPSKVSDAVLLDDHRWTHAFWANIKAGKKYKFTLKDVKELHDKIVKEIEKRGMEHNTPLKLEEGVESIVPEIWEKDSEPTSGIYLVPPHARLIAEGDKTLIVKKRKFEKYIGVPIYLCSGNFVYGVIKIKSVREISLEEFKESEQKHKIREAERINWWGATDKFYAYEFDVLEIFVPPKRYHWEKGTQTWIQEVKFLDLNTGQILERLWSGI